MSSDIRSLVPSLHSDKLGSITDCGEGISLTQSTQTPQTRRVGRPNPCSANSGIVPWCRKSKCKSFLLMGAPRFYGPPRLAITPQALHDHPYLPALDLRAGHPLGYVERFRCDLASRASPRSPVGGKLQSANNHGVYSALCLAPVAVFERLGRTVDRHPRPAEKHRQADPHPDLSLRKWRTADRRGDDESSRAVAWDHAAAAVASLRASPGRRSTTASSALRHVGCAGGFAPGRCGATPASRQFGAASDALKKRSL